MIDNPKTRNVNWRALQVPPRRDKGVPTAWLYQSDVNVRHMTMGSWHASASNGGQRKT